MCSKWWRQVAQDIAIESGLYSTYHVLKNYKIKTALIREELREIGSRRICGEVCASTAVLRCTQNKSWRTSWVDIYGWPSLHWSILEHHTYSEHVRRGHLFSFVTFEKVSYSLHARIKIRGWSGWGCWGWTILIIIYHVVFNICILINITC